MEKKEIFKKVLFEIREHGLSIRKAAKLYNIPRTTLQDRVRGKVLDNCDTKGPSPYLTQEEEATLTNWCISLMKCGFPVNFEELSYTVKKIIDSSGRKTPFVDNKPGKTWMKGFFKRNSILTQRHAETISKGRAVVTEESIRKWFKGLEDYLEEIGHKDVLLDPKRIFNGDETGFQLCPKSGKVIAPRGSTHVYQVMNGNDKENITVLFVISADGNYAPPLVVFPYKRVPQNLMATIPKGWCVGRSDTGWMKSDVFYE